MRKVINVLTAVAVGLASWGVGSVAADDLEDARVIVTAKSNTVKKWHYPPRFVVVHDQPVDQPAFAEVTDFIAAATGLPIEQPTFVNLTDATFDPRFYTASRYSPRKTESGQMTSDLLIAQKEDLQLSANIFVFMVSPPLASHFIALTAYGRYTGNLTRSYVQGSGPCYFKVLSNGESIHFGTILIAPTIDPQMQKACIYEEMVQAMGLMNDAQDSPFFTFDNLAEEKPRDYDQRLLEALYDPRIRNGDEVDQVLNIYASLR
ncbi:DUF2927 domain-containing protein [uncultured Roseovarius sp.]|uniref:DUF2927 domain-containing protein n=1 Tax=uncultured Roseovarius sp. TaxID=293344 RepID=UPI0026116312|nr:DUF2927 domain-containing protein [uncultured Roseovarius sp.]